MSPGDLRELLSQAQHMQARVAEIQRQLARRTVEASAGGGMVTAVATGELRIAEVRIEPEVLRGDPALLQDLVTAAVNAALASAQRMVQEELQKVAGLPSIQIPLGKPQGG